MNKNIQIALVGLLFLTSCSEKQAPKVDQEHETPEVLQKPELVNEVASFSKRYKENIVDKLYNEALESDAKLMQLDKEIKKMLSMENDSLFAFEKYKRMNNQYWNAVEYMVGQVKDSTLQKETKTILEQLKSNYQKSISNHDTLVKNIQQRRHELDDQHILIKLFVTLPMIENYQKNEKPSTRPLKNVEKEYDRLILEAKQYTRRNK